MSSRSRLPAPRASCASLPGPLTHAPEGPPAAKVAAAQQATTSRTLSTASMSTLASAPAPTALGAIAPTAARLTHLQRLEAEAIQIMREVVAECERPVMLYSIGKDSSVMLHLAAKAFYPAKPPFPLLHVDTTWKFQEMYKMRERAPKAYGFDLLVHQNPEAIAKGINPFDHGPLHTDMWKTQGLKQ